MKRIIFIIAFLLLVGLSLQAAPVSQSRALDVAKKVFAAQPATKAVGDVKLIWDGEDIATKSAVQPAFYVFGRDGGGFVIVAGDDNVRPILAFSEDSPFAVEGMPENVKWWMDQIKNHVRSARTQNPEIARQWSGLIGTKAMIDEALLSNKDNHSATVCWNQSAPANELAPKYEHQENKQSVCGCLPLAVSEILTWFGWPNQGVGSTDAYQYYPVNESLTTIPSTDLTALNISDGEWTALQALDTYQEFLDCTDPIRSKLSELVYDCGLLVHASFNAGGIYGGTGAQSTYVPAAFANHMKYNKGCYIAHICNHSIEEWNGILKLQVLSHPVLYCGIASLGGGNDAGHAYVLDGCATITLTGEDVFHFNFGWGSTCNGYYYSNYQDLRDIQPYNFDTMLEALIDFVPDKTGDSKPARKLTYVGYTINKAGEPYDLYGIKTNVPITKDVEIPIEFGLIYNYTSASYDGAIKVVLEDKNGNIKQDNLLNATIAPVPGSGSYVLFEHSWSTYPITNDLAFGDRLAIYYTDNDDKDHYVKLVGPLDGSIVYEIPVMPASFIKTENSYSVGDNFQFQLMNNDTRYLGTEWTITDKDGIVSSNIPQSQREFKLTKSGTYRIEAAVAPTVGAKPVETIVTYITVTSTP